MKIDAYSQIIAKVETCDYFHNYGLIVVRAHDEAAAMQIVGDMSSHRSVRSSGFFAFDEAVKNVFKIYSFLLLLVGPFRIGQ